MEIPRRVKTKYYFCFIKLNVIYLITEVYFKRGRLKIISTINSVKNLSNKYRFHTKHSYIFDHQNTELCYCSYHNLKKYFL